MCTSKPDLENRKIENVFLNVRANPDVICEQYCDAILQFDVQVARRNLQS